MQISFKNLKIFKMSDFNSNRTYDRFLLHINCDRKGSVTVHKYYSAVYIYISNNNIHIEWSIDGKKNMLLYN